MAACSLVRRTIWVHVIVLGTAALLLVTGGCGGGGSELGEDAGGARQRPRTAPARYPLGSSSVQRDGVPVTATEVVTQRADGLEQRWRIDARPAGDGPLRVEVPVPRALGARSFADGLRIVTRGPIYRYGHGTWVDGRGARTHVPARWSGDGIVLEVPGDVLAESVYPAWLDPVLTAERELGIPPIWDISDESWPVAVAYGRGVGLIAWFDQNPVGLPTFRVQRTDRHAAPLDDVPQVVTPVNDIRDDAALVHREGEFMIAWVDGTGLSTRRMAATGDWIDDAPRPLLPGDVGGVSLAATDTGFLLAVGTLARGAELLDLADDGALRSRRALPFGGAPHLACSRPTGPCVVAAVDGRDVVAMRFDAAGRPLESGPTTVATDAITATVGGAGTVHLVAWQRTDGSYAAVRIGSDGARLDAVPLELPLLEEGGPRILSAPTELLVLDRMGRAERVGIDGTVGPAPFVVPGRWFRPPPGAWADGHWLFTTERPVAAVEIAPDGMRHDGPVLAERFANAGGPKIASGPSGWVASWLETTSSSARLHLRAVAVDPDGSPGAPVVELGTQKTLMALARTDAGFVLLYREYPDYQLLVLDDLATVLRGPFVVPMPSWAGPSNIQLRCAQLVCLVRARRHSYMPVQRTFDPATGALGGEVPAREHEIASGPTGHLEIERVGSWPDADLLGRRLSPDGSVVDSTPIPINEPAYGVADHVAGATASGWVVAYSRGSPVRIAHVSPAGVVESRGSLDRALGSSLEAIHCGASGCWLRTDLPGWTFSQLTWLDADGRIGDSAPIEDRDLMFISTRDRSTTLLVHSRWDPWPGRDAERLYTSVLGDSRGLGEPCGIGIECVSGHCVDDVCCDSACSDTIDDCEACSVAAGAADDGLCGAVAAARICRESTGPCDAAEACDGSTLACPPDARQPAGAVCRGVAGPCDVAETCDGVDEDCPDDLFITGDSCRAADAPCDAEERCDGTMALCPAEAVRPEGTLCRPAAAACDADELCDGVSESCPMDGSSPNGTRCGGDVCAGIAACSAGRCLTGPPLDCDDGDACTLDACDPSSGCVHHALEPCCRSDAECDDGDPCTDDRCGGGDCSHTPRVDCCLEDAECEDGDVCTRDRCIDHACSHRAACGRAVDSPAVEVTGSGCGCRTGAGDVPQRAFLLLVALLWIGWRRRRRRVCREPADQELEPAVTTGKLGRLLMKGYRQSTSRPPAEHRSAAPVPRPTS